MRTHIFIDAHIYVHRLTGTHTCMPVHTHVCQTYTFALIHVHMCMQTQGMASFRNFEWTWSGMDEDRRTDTDWSKGLDTWPAVRRGVDSSWVCICIYALGYVCVYVFWYACMCAQMLFYYICIYTHARYHERKCKHILHTYIHVTYVHIYVHK